MSDSTFNVNDWLKTAVAILGILITVGTGWTALSNRMTALEIQVAYLTVAIEDQSEQNKQLYQYIKNLGDEFNDIVSVMHANTLKINTLEADKR